MTRIFTSAPGSNEAVLFEPDASPLERGDPRVVRIPFVTRRPTLSEAKRVITAMLAIGEAEAALQPPQKVSAAPWKLPGFDSWGEVWVVFFCGCGQDFLCEMCSISL